MAKSEPAHAGAALQKPAIGLAAALLTGGSGGRLFAAFKLPPHWLLGAALLMLGSTGPSAAQGGRLEPVWSETLRIAQYNVQFVTPWRYGRVSPRHWPNTEDRARAIGRALACFDIVALNETINDRRRNQIFEAMELAGAACGRPSRLADGRSFALIAGPRPPGPGLRQIVDFITGDGALAVLDDEVAIASRLPVIATASIPYTVARGTDALAAKGVVHARLWRGGDAPQARMQGDAIDLFVTHLQANHPDVRQAQLEQLIAFMRERSDPTLPALLLGDFNIDGSAAARRDPRAEYHQMMRQLATLGWRDPGLALGGTDSWLRRRIDYIFVRSERLTVTNLQTRLFNDLRVRALSDHAAVTAELTWTPGRPQAPQPSAAGGEIEAFPGRAPIEARAD